MSNRAMSRLYGGSRAGSGGDSGAGFGALLDLITGNGTVEGGDVTTTPEGYTTMTPFKGKGGKGAARANELNATSMPSVVESINRYKAAIAEGASKERLQKLHDEAESKLRLAEEELKGKNQLSNTKQLGENEVNKTKEEGSQKRLSAEQEAAIKYMQTKGIPYTPETFSRVVDEIAPQVIANEQQRASMEGEALSSPNMQDAFNRGTRAQALMPEAQFRKEGAVTTPMGGTTSFAPFGSPIAAPNMQFGGTQSETVTTPPTIKGMPIGEPKVLRNISQGSFEQNEEAPIPVPPQNKAAAIQPTVAPDNLTATPNDIINSIYPPKQPNNIDLGTLLNFLQQQGIR